MFVTGSMFYDWLVNLDERGAPKPWLAESWDAKPGAKVWVFKLRRGVVFHNGKELDAQDVVYSINHHRGKDSKSAAKSLLVGVADVKASGKHEVLITLESGNADLPTILSDYHIGIGPQGTKFTDGVGTGAFVLETFQPGVRTIGKRNPNDWNAHRGYVNSAEVIAMNDASARISALLSRAVHIINRVDVNALPDLEKRPTVQIFNTPSAGHHTLAMRCDAPPYNNLLRLPQRLRNGRTIRTKRNSI
jgi:peptide/nickel transport system substrate-binding protein